MNIYAKLEKENFCKYLDMLDIKIKAIQALIQHTKEKMKELNDWYDSLSFWDKCFKSIEKENSMYNKLSFDLDCYYGRLRKLKELEEALSTSDISLYVGYDTYRLLEVENFDRNRN